MSERRSTAKSAESICPQLQTRLNKHLCLIYGEDCAAQVYSRIRHCLNNHLAQRKHHNSGPHWHYNDIVLITYGDTIQSPGEMPLRTLGDFLQEHLPDAFKMLHILPFFPWSSDDGFSVTDFRTVKPELGDWQDIASLHEHYDLAMDLVLNHCSREHLWFIDYISGSKPGCDYFIEMEDQPQLSLVTRPRSSPLLAGVRTHRGMRHVWATFSNDQIDLNFKNPDVLIEILDILLFYIRQGARMIRLDAVAYLWKEVGTNCIHLPQTHEVIKLFRSICEIFEPGVLILTETNVPHAENISYFGKGDEAHMIYQFSLPPLLLHAIYSGNTQYLKSWAQELAAAEFPDNCTFLNFTASHDGVGLRPLEGLIPKPDLEQMLEAMRNRGGYISTKSNSDGSESPYELNITYFDAFRDPHPEHARWHQAAFFLSQIFTLSFKGIPAVYIHSLLGTPNDTLGVERTGMTRAINRRKWDRGELENLLQNSSCENAQVFAKYKKLLAIRNKQPAFHPNAEQRIYDLDNGLFGLERIAPNINTEAVQRIIALYNFTPHTQRLNLDKLPGELSQWRELLHESRTQFQDNYLLTPPYATLWFSNGP